MVNLAADWLQSLLAKEILIPVTNFELSEIDPDHYQLRFDMPDADKSLPLSAEEVEGIADGNETIRELVKDKLLRLARM
jgi:hypothetical protein